MRRPAVALTGLLLAGAAAGAEPWTTLEPGLELASFAPDTTAAGEPESITVLRVDPSRFDFLLLSAAANEPPGNLAVREWVEDHGLVAAVNAGMFATDYVTHIGYMGCESERNNPRVNAYLSAAAFRPKRDGLPTFRIFDLDVSDVAEVREQYDCIVQNLRLIKRSRENRWPQQGKRWSEVCLAEDVRGRALLIHSREPHSMHDLNEILLALPIDLVCAQHLEGGPEAQLVYRDGDAIRQVGGAEQNRFGWPVPNVVGVVRKER